MKPVARNVLFGVGVVLFVIGVGGSIFWNRLYECIISKQMILSQTSEAYETWKDPPFPIFLKVYFFNCTNSDELIDTQFSAAPKLEEVGPYTFRERRVKDNITWNSNGTVSYQEYRIWHHDPEESVGSLDDLITNLNVPVVTAAYISRFGDNFTRYFLDTFITEVNETLFMTATARDLLFDGYNSSFLNEVRKISFVHGIPFDKFGWFYEKNNSHDGMYTIFTGETDTSKIALIDMWNGSRNLTYWNDTCNIIKGTVGENWPPNQKLHEPLTLFVSDVCRTITLDYNGKSSFHGISVYDYAPSNKLFANSSENSCNTCYETPGEEVPNGLVNETVCKFGAPAFLSFPHFYMADSYLAQRINGLHPDQTNHSTTVHLEPVTGAPVFADAKFQVNLLIESVDMMNHFKNIPRTYFPMFWFSENVDLGSSDLIPMLKLVTVILPTVFLVFFVLLTLLGFVLTLPAVVHFGKRICVKRTVGIQDDAQKEDVAQDEAQASKSVKFSKSSGAALK